MSDFMEFCVKWAKEIANNEKAISLGYKNEQLYAICCSIAMERAYRYEKHIDTDVWRFLFSHVNDVANHYYDAFVEKDFEKVEELLKL